MCAGGTKVEFGCEIASRGDLAAWGVGLLLEADFARREVRLRVGAMVAREMCWWSVLFQVLIESID